MKVIMHHNDLDGIASAALVLHYEKAYNGANKEEEEVSFIAIGYNSPVVELITACCFKEGDTLYLVDFSIQATKIIFLNTLAQAGVKVVWIDHHESSVKAAKTQTPEFETYLAVGECAALMCYKWCMSKIYGVEVDDVTKIPKLIQYINSWDVWAHNMPNTTEFHYGTYIKNLNPANFWDVTIRKGHDIFQEKAVDSHNFITSVIAAGDKIFTYKQMCANGIINSAAFEASIVLSDKYRETVYPCLVVNTTERSSTFFGDNIDMYPVCIAYGYNGKTKMYDYSIYSNRENVSCAALAEILGGTIGGGSGGGHAGAAGFRHEKAIFKPNRETVVKRKLFSNKTIVAVR